MENNENKWVCLFTPTHFTKLIILLLLLSSNGFAQNISKHYTSSMQEEGVLYFILPKSGFKNIKQKSELNYDITYFSANDSATLNFSYFDKPFQTIDSLLFTTGNKIHSFRVKRIFIETKKKKWHYRYSTTIAFKDLIGIFNHTERVEIILYTQHDPIALNIKPKTWNKQSAVLEKIFTLIKHNQ